MNDEDRRLRADEADAEPERFASNNEVSDGQRPPPEAVEKTEPVEDLTREVTASSASTSTGDPIEREEMGVSRMSTQYESPHDLERHPTALSRIQTGRSQHEQTIGASLRSRTISRHSRKPLPNFGAGKPYPPALPDREEYVVEFDGPEDPLHAQNWPLKKKLTVAAVLAFWSLTAAFGLYAWRRARL
jgi:MFS transporter, DHA1 family, multidrug resistance protein